MSKTETSETSDNDVATIGVVGAGVMGGGIAQVCAIAGYRVVVYDIDATALTAGHEHATTGRTTAGAIGPCEHPRMDDAAERRAVGGTGEVVVDRSGHRLRGERISEALEELT